MGFDMMATARKLVWSGIGSEAPKTKDAASSSNGFTASILRGNRRGHLHRWLATSLAFQEEPAGMDRPTAKGRDRLSERSGAWKANVRANVGTFRLSFTPHSPHTLSQNNREICRGHDLLEAIGLALRSAWGSCNQTDDRLRSSATPFRSCHRIRISRVPRVSKFGCRFLARRIALSPSMAMGWPRLSAKAKHIASPSPAPSSAA